MVSLGLLIVAPSSFKEVVYLLIWVLCLHFWVFWVGVWYFVGYWVFRDYGRVGSWWLVSWLFLYGKIASGYQVCWYSVWSFTVSCFLWVRRLRRLRDDWGITGRFFLLINYVCMLNMQFVNTIIREVLKDSDVVFMVDAIPIDGVNYYVVRWKFES